MNFYKKHHAAAENTQAGHTIREHIQPSNTDPFPPFMSPSRPSLGSGYPATTTKNSVAGLMSSFFFFSFCISPECTVLFSFIIMISGPLQPCQVFHVSDTPRSADKHILHHVGKIARMRQMPVTRQSFELPGFAIPN